MAGLIGRSIAFMIFFISLIAIIPPISHSSSAFEQYDDPIRIDGDDDLTPENGISSGSGTSDDPYIIKDKIFNYDYAEGIILKNTTKYIDIMNCTFLDFQNGDGIEIIKSKNVGLSNLSSHSIIGYYPYIDIRYSKNIYLDLINFSGIEIENTLNFTIQNSNTSLFIDSSMNISIHHLSSNTIFLKNSSLIKMSDSNMEYFDIMDCSSDMKFDLNQNNTVNGYPLLFLADGLKRDTSKITGFYGKLIFANESDLKIKNGERITNGLLILNSRNVTLDQMFMINANIDIRSVTNLHLSCSNYSYSQIMTTSSFPITIQNCSFFNSSMSLYDVQSLFISKSSFLIKNDHLDLSFKYINGIYIDNNTFLLTTSYSFFSFNSCQNIYFKDNIIRCEVYFSKCQNISITHNSLYSLSFYQNSNDIKIFSNTFPFYWNLYISKSSNATIALNYFFDDYGSLRLNHYCDNITLYNNYFNRYISYSYTDNPAIWSRFLTNITNIVNGPNIGGNYWRGYSGEDLDLDGFIDKPSPNPIFDPLPLLDLRGEINVTENASIPVTGQDFQIGFECEPIYPWAPLSFSFNFTLIDRYSEIIENEVLSGEKVVKENISFNISIPSNCQEFRYRYDVEDGYKKRASINNSFDVLDQMEPNISLIERSLFRTGEPAWIRFHVNENIAIEDYNVVVFANHRGNHSSLDSLELSGSMLEAAMTIDPCCQRLKFIVNASDVNSLKGTFETDWIDVDDIIEPSINITSGLSALRGKVYNLTFTARDNILCKYIDVISLVDGSRELIGVSYNGEGLYSAQIMIYELQPELSILIRVTDGSFNSIGSTYRISIGPIDLSSVIIDPGILRTGENATIAISTDGSDIEIDSASCSINGKAQYVIEIPSSFVTIPEDAERLTVSVDISDLGGYTLSFERSYPVFDTIAPDITVEQTTPICGQTFYLRPIYNDNIAILSHGIVFDTGSRPMEVMDNENTPSSMWIPHNAVILNVSVWAKDAANNTSYKNFTLPVMDRIPPEIESIVAEVLSGRIRIAVSATDNRGPDGMQCIVSSGSPPSELPMGLEGDMFVLWIDPMEGLDYFSFTVTARDASGNSKATDLQTIEIPRGEGDDISPNEDDDSTYAKIAITAIVIFLGVSALLFLIWKKGNRSGNEE